MTRVMETLQEDGILETSPEYAKALILCNNPLDRTVFMNMKSKEGHLNWINISW